MDLGLDGAHRSGHRRDEGHGSGHRRTPGVEGAEVAVLARGREALDETVAAFERRGAPMPSGSPWTPPTRRRSTRHSRAAAALGLPQRAGQHARSRSGPIREPRRRRLGRRFRPRARWPRSAACGPRCPCCAGPSGRGSSTCRRTRSSARARCSWPTRRPRRRSPAFPRTSSKSLAPEGILVNTVSPGSIVTASFSEGLRDVVRGARASTPPTPTTSCAGSTSTSTSLPTSAGPACPTRSPRSSSSSPRSATATSTGANVNVDGGSDFV